MMVNLLWALVALSAVALVFVAYPYFRARPVGGRADSPTDANVQLFHEHLEELQQQQQRGEISEQVLAELRLELQKGLLNESGAGESQRSAPRATARWVIWCLLAAVPLSAGLVYQQLGANEDLAIIEQLEQSTQLLEADAGQAGEARKAVLQRIEQRLQQQPDNFYYWVYSARLNVEQQQLGRALEAYRRADKLSNGSDLTLLQEYLQAAVAAREPNNRAELKALADRILALAPNSMAVLGLRGRLAFVEGDYRRALADWGRLVQALPPDHQTTRDIAAEMDKARQLLSESDLAAIEQSRVQLRVAVDPALAAAVSEMDDSAVLFVIARPVGQAGGPPLAVKRLSVAGLPLAVTLDDSNLMLPGSTLAQVAEVSVVARVSRSGAVQAQPGDLQGVLETVVVGSDTAELVIDTRL